MATSTPTTRPRWRRRGSPAAAATPTASDRRTPESDVGHTPERGTSATSRWWSARRAWAVGFGQEPGGDDAARSGEGGDDGDRAPQTDEVGGDAGDEGADGVAAVAPEPVDADGGGSPGGGGDVAD